MACQKRKPITRYSEKCGLHHTLLFERLIFYHLIKSSYDRESETKDGTFERVCHQ